MIDVSNVVKTEVHSTGLRMFGTQRHTDRPAEETSTGSNRRRKNGLGRRTHREAILEKNKL